MSLSDLLSRATRRVDGWLNLVTGVGGAGTRADFSFQVSSRLSDQELEDLFHGDSFAARICRAFPKHALRQGFEVSTGDPAQESAIAAKLDDLGARQRFEEAWTWARVFGGAVVFLGADDGQDPALPLDESALRAVRFLTVLDKRELSPEKWYSDPLDPRFGEVEVYRFSRAGGTSVDTRAVHATRLVRFDGGMVSRRRRAVLNGWGESELQRVYDKLQAFNGAFSAVGTLVQDSSQGVLAIKDLFSMMAADSQDTLKKRLELMDLGRSVGRAIMIDADGERFERVETGTLSGLADIVDRFMLLLSGASEIPVTILMGRSPAGLSATGESDTRGFYDDVRASQDFVLRPRLERLVRLLLLSRDGPTAGLEPTSWQVEFPPLWQSTPSEEADLRAKVAATDALYIDKGVLLPEEVAMARFRPEGWSAETTVDLQDRQAALAAEGTSAGLGGDGEPVSHDDVAAVVARVAGREIPRDAGVAQLVSLLGLDPAAAEQVMGEAGRTFFTKPDPAATAELDTLKGEHAQLQASARSTKAMLARVLEKNRNGELVVGSPISAAPTELQPGEELEAGDVVQVPATEAPAP